MSCKYFLYTSISFCDLDIDCIDVSHFILDVHCEHSASFVFKCKSNLGLLQYLYFDHLCQMSWHNVLFLWIILLPITQKNPHQTSRFLISLQQITEHVNLYKCKKKKILLIMNDLFCFYWTLLWVEFWDCCNKKFMVLTYHACLIQDKDFW